MLKKRKKETPKANHRAYTEVNIYKNEISIRE